MPRAPRAPSQPRKRRAPVRLTGGSGPRFENQIAARFLLDLLTGANSLGTDFGRVIRIDWQAREEGWLAEDLAINCRVAPDKERSTGISIKSDQQVNSNGFPADFVDIAWGQWLGRGTSRTFRKAIDAVVLLTDALPAAVQTDWSALLAELLETSPERIVSRLAATAEEGSQASALQRAMFRSFACPARYSHPEDPIETARLLHDIRLLDFDFNRPTSRDHGRALGDCQAALTSGDPLAANELWARLMSIADEKRPRGGSIDLRELLSTLGDRFRFRDYPDFRSDWEILLRRAQEAKADIETRIAGVAQLTRLADQLAVKARLTSAGACLLVGESGSGKSALLKEIAATDYPRTIWLSAKAIDYELLADFEHAIGLRNPLLDLLRLAPDRCLVVFDGIEDFSVRGLRIAARLTNALLTSRATHVHIAFSVQFQAAERKILNLAALGVTRELLQITPLSRPDDDEIQPLLQSFPNLQWIALRPELRPLLSNLKVLDWFARTQPEIEDTGPPQLVGLTAVIDRLWTLWTEGPADGLARSHLLMNLATIEADNLSRGLPRTRLGAPEQTTLPGLENSGLIRIRDDQVLLAHDLLGDWARMKSSSRRILATL